MEFDKEWVKNKEFCKPVKISQLMDDDSEDYFKGFEKGGIYIIIRDTKEEGDNGSGGELN